MRDSHETRIAELEIERNELRRMVAQLFEVMGMRTYYEEKGMHWPRWLDESLVDEHVGSVLDD